MKKMRVMCLCLCLIFVSFVFFGCEQAPTECQLNGHKMVEGVCSVCAETDANYTVKPCQGHVYENGVCATCNQACAHTSHDRLLITCNECGMRIAHTSGDDGVCSLCEYVPNGFIASSIDDKYVKDCDQRGKVETITYKTTALAGASKGQEITKKVNVYTPYGYSADKKYNVVYFIHGAFGTIDDYMSPDRYSDTQKAIDNMIKEGAIEPVIFAFPTNYDPDSRSAGNGILMENFSEQLRNDLIPAVETAYSTYLKYADKDNVTAEEIAASRDHRAMTGFSGGASQALQVAISGLDMFSYFGIYSNSYAPSLVAQGMLDKNFSQYKVKYMLHTFGSNEADGDGSGRAVWPKMYQTLADLELSKLKDGENMLFLNIHGVVHDEINLRSAFYNSLANCFFTDNGSEGEAQSAVGATAVSGTLTGEETTGFGLSTFEIKFFEDKTCTYFSNQYNFLEITDKGTYEINADGTISATFTKRVDTFGMGNTDHSTVSTAIQNPDGSWTMDYYCKAEKLGTVSGNLTVIK